MFAALVALACAGPDVCREDLERFPPDGLTWQCRQMAQEHRDWLEAQAQFWPHEAGYWQARREEAARRFGLWDLLWQAQTSWGYDPTGAEGMQRQLRDSLGWPAYYRGELPLPVPVEWLRIN